MGGVENHRCPDFERGADFMGPSRIKGNLKWLADLSHLLMTFPPLPPHMVGGVVNGLWKGDVKWEKMCNARMKEHSSVFPP